MPRTTPGRITDQQRQAFSGVVDQHMAEIQSKQRVFSEMEKDQVPDDLINDLKAENEALCVRTGEILQELAPYQADPTVRKMIKQLKMKTAAHCVVNDIVSEEGTISPQCNVGFNRVFRELTGNSELSGKLANAIVDHCANPSNCNWEPIDVPSLEELPTVLSQVQALANEGHIIVPAWYNPDPGESGHVALVVPGSMEYSREWECNMPMTMETGAGNKSPRKKMSHGLGKDKKGTIKFFRYKGPIKK